MRRDEGVNLRQSEGLTPLCTRLGFTNARFHVAIEAARIVGRALTESSEHGVELALGAIFFLAGDERQIGRCTFDDGMRRRRGCALRASSEAEAFESSFLLAGIAHERILSGVRGCMAQAACSTLMRARRVSAASASSFNVACRRRTKVAQRSDGMLSRWIHERTVWTETP